MVIPENWDALQLFLGCHTQWRHGPSGHRTGLDYAGCQAAAAADGVDWRKALNGLRVMEREVLLAEGEDNGGTGQRCTDYEGSLPVKHSEDDTEVKDSAPESPDKKQHERK